MRTSCFRLIFAISDIGFSCVSDVYKQTAKFEFKKKRDLIASLYRIIFAHLLWQTMENQFRILSLDGGGSWALIQVKCLQKLFGADVHGRQVLRHFDLAIGNSGGSLVLAALMADFTLAETLEMFTAKDKRDKMFARLDFRIATLIPYVNEVLPRYSTDGKRAGLQELLNAKDEHFSAKTLIALAKEIGDANGKTTDFVIIGYDYYKNRAAFFRSNPYSKADTCNLPNNAGAKFNNVTILDAIHASSNAPVIYFDKPAEVTYTDPHSSPLYFWDGGVTGNNNPVLTGVVEAIANGHQARNIRVLSIGTGNTYLPLRSATDDDQDDLTIEAQPPSITGDIKKMSKSITGDPPDSATYIAFVMLYGGVTETRNEFIRLNPMVSVISDGTDDDGRKRWRLPDPDLINDFACLKEMEMDATAQEDVNRILRFCDSWLNDKVRNQPVRMNANYGVCIGFDTFADAANAFRQW